MPDVEHGGGTGIGSGMGSGHGNADPDGPAFDPSAAPVGVNTETNVDIDPGSSLSTGQLNHSVFDPGAVPGGSHPDEGQPGFGVSQSFDDVDYGYYDGYATEVIGMKEPGATLSTQQMAHSVFDPGISLSTQQLGHPGATFSHNWDNPNTQFSPMESTPVDAWDNPNTQFSPMEFGPQHQMALSTQQLGQNVSVDARSVQEQAMNEAMAIGAQRANPNATTGVSPDSNPVGPTRSFQEQAMNEAMAIGAQRNVPRSVQEKAMNEAVAIGKQRSPLGTPVETELEANPNLISRYDQKQFYSALDDEDATEEAKALEIQGFLDHINRKNYTDTGFLSQFGIRSPQLTQREQIAQVKNFLGKHQASIDALNKAYTDQVNQNPGLRQALPGYGLITGLMSLMGLEPQHTHPAVQALYDKMAQLGMIEPETPEMTDAKKIAQCNATPGYRWDSAKHACVKFESSSV